MGPAPRLGIARLRPGLAVIAAGGLLASCSKAAPPPGAATVLLPPPFPEHLLRPSRAGRYAISARLRGPVADGSLAYVIRWSAPNSAAEVRVTTPGGPTNVFARTSTGKGLASFILPWQTYVFALYRSPAARWPQVSVMIRRHRP